MTAVALVAHIVAHQGGWDELLLALGPIVAIVGVLAVAKRRVDRQASIREMSAPTDRSRPTKSS